MHRWINFKEFIRVEKLNKLQRFWHWWSIFFIFKEELPQMGILHCFPEIWWRNDVSSQNHSPKASWNRSLFNLTLLSLKKSNLYHNPIPIKFHAESLRLIQMCPRSVSDRIVHKLSTINKKPSHHVNQNPYQELEAAYVAQICWTWEALNWNYSNFVNKKLSSNCNTDLDTGCPAKLAQQFQQFQVLLQRYIENEPYDHGRRPEIYARMRRLAPNLLQVPKFIGTFFFLLFPRSQFTKWSWIYK